MSVATITRATPQEVTWRVGNSLHIESTRSAVEAWAEQVDLVGHVTVDGLVLTRGDVNNMLAAMDDADAQWRYDARLEKRIDRARDFESNWS